MDIKTVAVLSHILTTVPAYDLENYLINKKVDKFLFIGNPLFYKEGRPGPFFKIYKDGLLTKTKSFKNRKFPMIIQYCKDFFLSVYWVISSRQRYDVIICLDNLNALAGLFLKKIGLAKKVVYYTIDFVPVRFKSKPLNRFYHFLDEFCVNNCDCTWNVSPRMEEGRKELTGLGRTLAGRQIVVPIGIWFDRLERKTSVEIERNSVIYAGGLLKHQGVQLMLEATPSIVEQIPDFKFKIIGLGEYENDLKSLVKKLAIEKYVDFIGYLEKHSDVEKELSKCSLGIAMYNHEADIWSYYADPSKIKSYLSAGLPVITTNVTYLGKDLEDKKCGFVIDYDPNILSTKVIELLKDQELLEKYRANAISYSKKLDWNIIFDEALSNIN